MAYYLPSKIPSYLLRLFHTYGRTNPVLHEVIGASRIAVIEGAGWDNWDGGIDGHDVRLYVPIETLAKLDIDEQVEAAASMHDDLRKLAQGVEGEFINAVRIEAEDDSDPDCRRATPFSGKPPVNPDTLPIWKPGLIRIFISHRDEHKGVANGLALGLEGYGFSCFVAHETIPANDEWRRVILSGLETMEVMLVLLTNGFRDSYWTMQEVGYALGRGVPYVSIKLEQEDPAGFISHTQALRGRLAQPEASVSALASLLAKAVGQQDRLRSALISSFVTSPDWGETTVRFDRMVKVVDRLSEDQVRTVIEGYRRNDQLYRATYLTYAGHRRLKAFLETATGKICSVDGRDITLT